MPVVTGQGDALMSSGMIAAFFAEHRAADSADHPFHLIIGGETPGDDVSQADEILAP